MHTVIELLGRAVTSLRHTLSRIDTITLWVIRDQGHSYMRKCQLSYESVWTTVKELPYMSDVLISEEDLQKLDRAGLAHLLYEGLGSRERYTPQQTEFAFMTLHNAHDS